MIEPTIIYPHAYTGLCIHSDYHRMTVNVHSVGDQVFYGKYDDDFEREVDNGCIGLYRVDSKVFDRMIAKAVFDGHVLYSLINN